MLRLASEQLERPPCEAERLVGAAASLPLEAAAASWEPIFSFVSLLFFFFSLRDRF